jgi:hypothetical protein
MHCHAAWLALVRKARGEERTGQDRTGQDRRGEERTGQEMNKNKTRKINQVRLTLATK